MAKFCLKDMAILLFMKGLPQAVSPTASKI